MADNYVVVTTDGNKIFRAKEVEGILYPIHVNEAIGDIGDEAKYQLGGDASAISLLKGLLGYFSGQVGTGDGSPLYVSGDGIGLSNMLKNELHVSEINTPLGDALYNMLYDVNGSSGMYAAELLGKLHHFMSNENLYSGEGVFHGGDGISVFTGSGGGSVFKDSGNTGMSITELLGIMYDYMTTGSYHAYGAFKDLNGNGVFNDQFGNNVFVDNSESKNTIANIAKSILDNMTTDWNSIVKDGNGESVFYSNWTQKSLVEWMNRLVGNTTSYSDASYPVSPLFNSFGSSLSGFFGNETDEAAVAYNDAVSMMSFTKYMAKLLEEIRDASGTIDSVSSTMNLNDVIWDQSTMMSQALIDGVGTPYLESILAALGDVAGPYLEDVAVALNNMNPATDQIASDISAMRVILEDVYDAASHSIKMTSV